MGEGWRRTHEGVIKQQSKNSFSLCYIIVIVFSVLNEVIKMQITGVHHTRCPCKSVWTECLKVIRKVSVWVLKQDKESYPHKLLTCFFYFICLYLLFPYVPIFFIHFYFFSLWLTKKTVVIYAAEADMFWHLVPVTGQGPTQHFP